jgi:hypothetical protein
MRSNFTKHGTSLTKPRGLRTIFPTHAAMTLALIIPQPLLLPLNCGPLSTKSSSSFKVEPSQKNSIVLYCAATDQHSSTALLSMLTLNQAEQERDE